MSITVRAVERIFCASVNVFMYFHRTIFFHGRILLETCRYSRFLSEHLTKTPDAEKRRGKVEKESMFYHECIIKDRSIAQKFTLFCAVIEAWVILWERLELL